MSRELPLLKTRDVDDLREDKLVSLDTRDDNALNSNPNSLQTKTSSTVLQILTYSISVRDALTRAFDLPVTSVPTRVFF